jgi:shikimate 5-dehydrogenase
VARSGDGTSAGAATAALRERSKVAAVEQRTSARAAALARRRAKGGSGSYSGTPEQLRWSESEEPELNVSLVFNPEDWSRDTEPATATEERSGHEPPLPETLWTRWKKENLPPECQKYIL